MCQQQLNSNAQQEVRLAGKDFFKDSQVFHRGHNVWTFRATGDFDWRGKASCERHARYLGWSAWLQEQDR